MIGVFHALLYRPFSVVIYVSGYLQSFVRALKPRTLHVLVQHFDSLPSSRWTLTGLFGLTSFRHLAISLVLKVKRTDVCRRIDSRMNRQHTYAERVWRRDLSVCCLIEQVLRLPDVLCSIGQISASNKDLPKP